MQLLLAEFCLMSILNHYRGLAILQARQAAHHWERFATNDLQGKHVGIGGLGTTVDEDTLIQALRSGKLGGAALDVFEEEPLPAGSPSGTCPMCSSV